MEIDGNNKKFNNNYYYNIIKFNYSNCNKYCLYKGCSKKNKITKNNVLAYNNNNTSSKMRYAQLVRRNGSHWSNNKLYNKKVNSILNNNYNNSN
mgnify:CR=1 FL=1